MAISHVVLIQMFSACCVVVQTLVIKKEAAIRQPLFVLLNLTFTALFYLLNVFCRNQLSAGISMNSSAASKNPNKTT